MQFKLVFTNYKNTVLNINDEQVGLSIINLVEKELKTPVILEHLPDKVEGMFGLNRYEININIELAKKSNLFADKNLIEIPVDKNFINNYVYKLITKHFNKITIVNKVNQEKLLADWESAGFPLDWTNKNI